MKNDARERMGGKTEVHEELLRLYIRNHRSSVFSYIFVCLPFIYLKFRFYPGATILDKSFLFSLFLLLCSLFFVANQQFIYRRVFENQNDPSDDVHRIVLELCLNKALYILPWLYFLFQPLQSNYVFSHLPGYAFVFCAISSYVSASSQFFRVFLWDLFLTVGTSLFVVFLHFHVQETPYIGIILLMAMLGALITGWRIHQSAVELILKKMQLENAVQAAEQASKAKSDFLAFVSHEIRTPMTGILGMVNFLRQTPLNSEQKEYLDTISGCSGTLMNTLNDSLDIAKIEAGKLKVEMRAYEPKALLQSVARLVEPAAAEKGLTVLFDIESDFPEYNTGDPNRLQQVVTNLMNNAIKFTDKGTVKLSASVLESPPRLKISVTDTGIGIGEEDQKRLFRKFSQAENARSNTQKGFGLGLSISKKLMSLMGGTIGLESKKGHGTTLWIELPYKPPSEKPKQIVRLRDTSGGARYSVLIVDDNRINRMISQKLLEKVGHRVVLAETGRQAIDVLQHSKIDMILMDINMPDMTGIEVKERITRQLPKIEKVPVVALTANMTPELWGECKKVGMVDYLLKPYQPNDLYGMLARYASVEGAVFSAQSSADGEELHSLQQMNIRMDGLLSMFGLEYTRMFIKMGLDEVDTLLDKIKSAHARLHKEELRRAAHDLTASSGTLGMDGVCKVAKVLEAQVLLAQDIVIEALIHEIVSRLDKDRHDLLDWLDNNNKS